MTEECSWSNASRNRYQAALRSFIFRIAVEDKKLFANPATGIKHLQEDNSRVRYLSLDEEEALLKALRDRYPTYTPIVVLGTASDSRGRLQRGDPEAGHPPDEGSELLVPEVCPDGPLRPYCLQADGSREAGGRSTLHSTGR